MVKRIADENGITKIFTMIKALVNGKADKTHSHQSNEVTISQATIDKFTNLGMK